MYIDRKLKVGEHSSAAIKLDQEKSEKLSMPVYCIQGSWPIYFFDNNKKEKITLPGGAMALLKKFYRGYGFKYKKINF